MDSFDHILKQARETSPDDGKLADLATELAAGLLAAATRQMRFHERRQALQMAAMMDDEKGKIFLFSMTDQVFRAPAEARQASRLRQLLAEYGAPHFLPPLARLSLIAGAWASAIFPKWVMPLVAGKMRRESSAVILPAQEQQLRRHIHSRRDERIRVNLNLLGEAVLGEEEARHRLEQNLAKLADPDTDYISIKISAIFSQIHLVAYEETLTHIKERLRLLYRAAMAGGQAKFVNLDMEEYRDLRLTCDAFCQVLDEAEFMKLEAGIVLQAYLPDSWPVQQRLNAWARQRVERGGAGIKIRIVKGANLAMEKVDAEIHDWPLAPYHSKLEVDANFKRMLHEACKPENAAAVRVGLASHNLFDISYAMLLRVREGVEDRIEFEMLEGMANHQARTVRDTVGHLLMYAPVVKKEDFHSAIAYLVRRLDENTSPENFLHDLFEMTPGSASWHRQKERFLNACALKNQTLYGPQRIQDRSHEKDDEASSAAFSNEPDTDWSLPHNAAWIRSQVESMKSQLPQSIPLQIGGEVLSGGLQASGHSPSHPEQVLYHYELADLSQISRALDAAVVAQKAWSEKPLEERRSILRAVAVQLRNDRGTAIATMVLDAGKAVMEADGEVSEAIDFANYYARSFSPEWFDGASFTPLGTVLVTPPWNFPFAIPCGSVLAALMAGNTVILKPAPESVMTAWVMVNSLWAAGVPREVLQFVSCADHEIGQALVSDDRVNGVILTGAYETARMFLSWKPEMKLFAETSGKNSLIIMASSDSDLAIKDLVKSAFGHAGQKCSAASLAIIEAELYDDPGFLRRLKDAAASLKVGPSTEYDSIVTPLIRPPGKELMRALTTLDEGESWLLEPKMISGNECLWSPGIKLGVKEDSWFRRTECFGPVLGLIRARDLDHAIGIQNGSAFGLTGGIHALDPQEIDQWSQEVEVGNAYINRSITGAIVQRQPFGGWKRSCFGPGAKAGGPNYVEQFGTWQQVGLPARLAAIPSFIADQIKQWNPSDFLQAAAASDAWWMQKEFQPSHDPSALQCESNIFRYRPFRTAVIRIESEAQLTAGYRSLLATMAAGIKAELSVAPGVNAGWDRVTHETIAQFELRLRQGCWEIARVFQENAALCEAAVEAGVRLISKPVVASGRIELLCYFREQSRTETRHRHGRLLAESLPAD
jgi:RHH-type transcriptional regulator, proline utilization regulon repressor / proline dehydrogenase / delta 1-pyrroline-5-carboxylate dehydrogenase